MLKRTKRRLCVRVGLPQPVLIVNAIGPIRQLMESDVKTQNRYLSIVPVRGTEHGAPMQVQVQ